jgi:Holliday junction resolvase
MTPSIPRESSIVTSIMKELRKHGAMVIKIHGDPYMLGGTPDLIGCASGRCFVLEVKRPGEKPRALQVQQLEKWRKAGAVVGVVTSVKDAMYLVFGE